MSHLSSLQQALKTAGYDAALLSSKVNERYISGFDYDDGLLLVTPEKGYLITDFRYTEAATEACASFLEVVAPGHIGMLAFVRNVLEEGGWSRVLIEEDELSFADYHRYAEKLPGIKLESGASAMLDSLRIIKDEKEIETMARAQAITDAAFAHIVKWIKPDSMTEIDVALELEFFMRSHGSEGVAFQTIAVSGSASSRPHGVPRNVPLEKGFLTMDFGAAVDGYCSDMTRTVVLGKSDADMKKLYNTVLRAQLAALDAAKEGANCVGLDKIARDIIDGAGYEGRFGHSLGHGVGLYIHENPALAQRPRMAETLQRGHVVTVEPGIYIEGLYGCRIEDMICIRPDGTMYDFTHSPNDLIEL